MTRISYDDGQFSKSTVQAGTYQGYDIEALQYLYGASTTVQAPLLQLGRRRGLQQHAVEPQ
jgi:uncharacterized Fe-S cluster-containing radical SAM superfamily protein